MKRNVFLVLATFMALFFFAGNALAHFGMIIPSDPMICKGENRVITLDVRFWHPMEGIPMSLEKPVKFGVMANGKKISLLDSLQPVTVKGHKAWKAEYKVRRPGVYIFYMEPKPYWEPAEDKFIIHYTKTVVTAFGLDEGWDEEVGLKAEIVPLSRPYGLYAGNVFQGIVKVDGKPVPFAEVEVEYYNQDGKFHPPNEYMVTQTLKADQNGVFTFGVPWSGWWGFAALTTSKTPMKFQGKDKEVELGAIIWVHFEKK
ncbi:MAG: DUF4198 domain-containing protein [Thermodesulfobacteria bacterium]|nr:DUF4198 domain-containing protein [Thermodesulfobacteriota bacterium]